ncbi:hypothetical protein KCU76_g33, partial [Aureobasidium melanogenum]
MIGSRDHDVRDRVQGATSNVRMSTSKGFGEGRENKTASSLAEQIPAVVKQKIANVSEILNSFAALFQKKMKIRHLTPVLLNTVLILIQYGSTPTEASFRRHSKTVLGEVGVNSLWEFRLIVAARVAIVLGFFVVVELRQRWTAGHCTATLCGDIGYESRW